MQRHQYRWSCLVRRLLWVRHSVLCRMALRCRRVSRPALRWPGVCRLVLRCRQLPRLCCSRRGRVRVCQLIRGRCLRLVRWFCPVRRRYRRLRRRCLWPVRQCWLRLRGLFPLVVTPEQGYRNRPFQLIREALAYIRCARAAFALSSAFGSPLTLPSALRALRAARWPLRPERRRPANTGSCGISR